MIPLLRYYKFISLWTIYWKFYKWYSVYQSWKKSLKYIESYARICSPEKLTLESTLAKSRLLADDKVDSKPQHIF